MSTFFLELFGYAVAIIGFFLISLLFGSPLWIRRQVRDREKLTAEKAAATHFRFFYSKHVGDLRLTFWASYLIFVFISIIFLYFGLVSYNNPPGKEKTTPITAFLNAYTLFPTIALALGAVVGWSYRTAGLRLGVVDLFACEIDSLSRVGTIVDIASRYVAWYDDPSIYLTGSKDLQPSSGGLEPKEEYFPIFNSNSKDLQVLEAAVVTNITAFYTFMKSFRDSRRSLVNEILPAPEEINEPKFNKISEEEIRVLRSTIFRVVYMLFLAYESARKAVKDLIEFQPTEAECTIMILITELKCFSLLMKYCKQYLPKEDIHFLRLDLRIQDYHRDVNEVYCTVMKHPTCEQSEGEKDWCRAFRLINELNTQYDLALHEKLGECVPSVGRQ